MWPDQVVISHKTLHRLAKEMDGFEGKHFILIHNTARCGSTLLCQMFSQMPSTRVISEPWAFLHLQRYHRHGFPDREGNWTRDYYEALTASMLKLQLKPRIENDFTRVVVKLSLLSSAQVPLIKSLFPFTKLMFITRHIRQG